MTETELTSKLIDEVVLSCVLAPLEEKAQFVAEGTTLLLQMVPNVEELGNSPNISPPPVLPIIFSCLSVLFQKKLAFD